jgi:hypothetical protein
MEGSSVISGRNVSCTRTYLHINGVRTESELEELINKGMWPYTIFEGTGFEKRLL